jgi:hypothetical protein
MPTAYPTRCLPEQTGGLFVSAETREELVAALQKTPGCELLSDDVRGRTPAALAARATPMHQQGSKQE